MDTPTSQIDFARKPDRAMVMGIVGLVVYFVGCGCGMGLGILVLPIWLAAGGLGGYAYWLAKQALEELDAGEWPEELRSKASTGQTLGIISACLGGGTTLVLGGLTCAGLLFYVVMMVAAGASGGF